MVGIVFRDVVVLIMSPAKLGVALELDTVGDELKEAGVVVVVVEDAGARELLVCERRLEELLRPLPSREAC